MGIFANGIAALRELIYEDKRDGKVKEEEEEKLVLNNQEEQEVNIDEIEEDLASLQSKINIKEINSKEKLKTLTGKIDLIQDPDERYQMQAEIASTKAQIESLEAKDELEAQLDTSNLTIKQKETLSSLFANLINTRSPDQRDLIQSQIEQRYEEFGLDKDGDLVSDLNDKAAEAKYQAELSDLYAKQSYATNDGERDMIEAEIERNKEAWSATNEE